MAAHFTPPRRTRLLALVVLGIGLAAGPVLAGTAWADPSPAPAPAPGAPSPTPAPVPGVPSPIPAPPPGGPTPSVPPSPPTPAPSPGPAPPSAPSPSGDDDDPSWYDIPGQIRKAIHGFFAWMAEKAINPVMETLGSTVLSTPDLTTSPHVTALWKTTLVTANGIYVLFVIAGAFVITSRETLQTQYGLKQIAPRLVLAAVLSNVSLMLCGKAIEAANAVTAAIVGQGVDPSRAADAMSDILIQPLNGGNVNILLVLLVIAALVLALAVSIIFVMRVALLVALTGFAPLALICHATPQTEGLAYTWWRAFGACLGLQLAQAVIVLTTIRVFLTPSGLVLLGVPASAEGLLGVLVCLAMLWLLIKLPGLMKQFVIGPLGLQSQGRGLVGQLLQAYVMFKTLGAAAGLLGGTRPQPAAQQSNRGTAGARTGTSTARPVSAARDGAGTPRPAPSRPSPSAPVAFSNPPTTQTPLPVPAGAAGAPPFSHPQQPGTPATTPTGPTPAAPFSHPHPPQPSTARPAGRPAPATFSNATTSPANSAPAGPPPAATFSAPQAPQSAPRRPPAPVTPVFSSAPPTPRTRPTAARRPTTESRTASPRPAATRSSPPPVTRPPATVTPRPTPRPASSSQPSPASRPAPATPPPSPPRPTGSTCPVFRAAPPTPASPPPSSPATAPSPPSSRPAKSPSPPSPPPARRRPRGGK
ncbi:hypothetical protein QLQ12_21530 [Actinoplanes sp. NEAU-A12]|uniref:Uncharacterized protein n=1 Tax=Actinoplanes sandaracinus TaxID=3045177 RepID=A0ABT6WN76_9ACTN|nr:hypothetical protein [Actinoplanes sandaracinus]MDI6101199.1 hypothetical protein [Actinoplanes sandaracinus]